MSVEECVSWICPLNVTELPTEIVAPVASVCELKYFPAVPPCSIVILAPLELTNWRLPAELAEATISPIAALFIAAIVSVKVLALEKFMAFPFMLIFEAASEVSELSTSIVTKL